MPHDPELVAETRGWFVRAHADLASGQVDIAAEPPLTGDAVFPAQQAAEKAMKGFLTWHGQVFRKTHNLTEYAWKYRYPGEPHEPPREEAEGALALAREVYDAVLARLPAEVWP
jgi:HEPN domain-containing protein